MNLAADPRVVAVNDNGSLVVIGSANGNLKIFKMNSSGEACRFDHFGRSVELTEEPKEVSLWDDKILIVHMRTDFRCFEFEEENGLWTERVVPPAILAISKNGRTALKRNNDGELQICSREEATWAWKERCYLDLTLDENHNVLFNTDGTALVVAQKVEESSSVSVFASGPEDGWARTGDSFICDCEISCIAISNDGQRLAIVTGEKQLKLFAIKEDKDKKYKWKPRFGKDHLRTAASTRKVTFVGKSKWDVVAISHVEGKHVRYGRRQHVAGWHNEECIGELSGGGNHVFDIEEGKLRGYLRKQLSHVVRTSRCTLRGALLKDKRKKSNLLSLFEDLAKSFTDAYDQAVFYLNSALAVSEDKISVTFMENQKEMPGGI